MPHTLFYRDLAYVFGGAVLGGLAARALKQPTILGYVVAGILLGPFTAGPTISDVHALELLAELGVILLMYSIGIEFSPADLLEVKWTALIGAPLGIVLSMLLGMGAGYLFGWNLAKGAAVGAIISVASTMVLSRLLIDRGELLSVEGKAMIGMTLVEDVAVVILTIMLPLFNSLSGTAALSLGYSLLKAIAILVPVSFVAFKIVPPVLKRVAAMRNDELFVLVAVAIGLATAAITEAVGLSLALGAFLAGLIVSGSETAHQTLSKLLPIRDVFVALFFVTIGAMVNPRALLTHPMLLIGLLLLIVVGKFIIWAGVMRLFRYPWTTAVRAAVGLTQIGEFSYVLLQVARGSRLVDDVLYNSVLMASLVSILLNAVLVRLTYRYTGSRPEVQSA